ncbi:Thymidylate kinase [Candidatus Ecksteinia adelgidicola]|nr:Thymidylate kinase [Candidatus Ecksteinia adelgidicola]
MNSKFIVLEGLEGAGKTTGCNVVSKALQSHGIQDIIFTREPGGTPIAEKLRYLFKEGINGEFPTIKTELLMLYAARTQLVETVIQPALKRGTWVIGDRHDLSSHAYQGGGHCMDPKLIISLRNIILNNFYPDLTLYLDIPPLIGLDRIKNRSHLDRIEKKETLSFFIRIRERYLELAKLNKSIIIINASDSIEKVTTSIYVCVKNWIKQQKNLL